MERIKQGIGQNGLCSLCGHGEEDLIHVLMNYSVAREVLRLQEGWRVNKKRSGLLGSIVIWDYAQSSMLNYRVF
ncbi:hypothetical protein J1N35_010719 [Gossypium stocksii]|uniref:Reverse transcriptase zinc-binding domain-containing protein n=1 Tax=Gossypium stocksii TaxID=47602 RepID=A0A9D4AD00_9ROSI|nr:hypothetical protein J1N35_010719 [Gossypium stocksii]